MELLRLEKLPKGYEYYDSCDFGAARELEEINCDLAAYWYGTGSYEGTGNIIFRVNESWYHSGCSHCSCYGPLDSLSLTNPQSDYRNFLDNCSNEMKVEIEPLMDLLDKHLNLTPMKYRITKFKNEFRVEKLEGGNWKPDRQITGYDPRDSAELTDEVRFKTQEEAEKYIERKRPIVWETVKEIEI